MRVGNQAALQELAERIAQADAVVIGGGSGLSSAAGYDHYHWSPALSEALAPFREQYGFTSPLAGFYHCFSSYGEQWGYYSQYIRFMWEAPTGQPYLDLQALGKGTDRSLGGCSPAGGSCSPLPGLRAGAGALGTR